MKAPTLATERLILRSFESDDVSAFAEVMSDKEAMRDLYAIGGAPDEPVGFAKWFINDAITSWSKSEFGNWAVCANSSDLGPDQKVIGFAGFLSEELLLENPDEALEVGWGIHPGFSGRGLATEASLAVLEYGFGVIKAGKIVALTGHENTPSRRLMERLGMKHSEDDSPYGYDDCVLYAVTKEQWSG
jgi:RimJ/RimL family protein N-acetyltransferase